MSKPNQNNRPFVFVRCLTYNHEAYIEDALKGFAMQKTDFPFLAVVIDDCSTDGTADIVRRYEAQYPDKIKGIYLPHNFHQTKEDKRPYYQEYIDKATYCAECEGDDYWTDPYKLQKQVDFMESHPDYSLCFHEVQVYNLKTKHFEINSITRDISGTSDIAELAKGNFIHTLSVMMRYNAEVHQKLKSMGYVIPSDYVLWMLYAEKGKIYKLPDVMAVYRVGTGFWSGNKGIGNEVSMIITLTKLWSIMPQVRDALWSQIQELKSIVVTKDNCIRMKIDSLEQSIAYRIGNAIIKPLIRLKKLICK